MARELSLRRHPYLGEMFRDYLKKEQVWQKDLARICYEQIGRAWNIKENGFRTLLSSMAHGDFLGMPRVLTAPQKYYVDRLASILAVIGLEEDHEIIDEIRWCTPSFHYPLSTILPSQAYLSHKIKEENLRRNTL